MIEFKEKENGFKYIEIKNDSADAKIAFVGAHVFEYKRKKEKSILWLSETSDFELGKAIRGGIPICWPSFGMNNPNLPQHGFARLYLWKLLDTKEIDANTTQVMFTLNDTKESRDMFNYKFRLELKVTISDKLTMELKTTNLDKTSFKFTQAFHSYFQVSDISNVHVKGLDKKPYLNALISEISVQNGDIKFKEEVDRVYQEVDNKILLIDKERTTSIINEGSSSVVVWNPWVDKCARMSAMKDDAYKEFVCIESANAFDDFRIIKPQDSYILKTIIASA